MKSGTSDQFRSKIAGTLELLVPGTGTVPTSVSTVEGHVPTLALPDAFLLIICELVDLFPGSQVSRHPQDPTGGPLTSI